MTRITRIEVIDETGRSYVNKNDNNDVIYQLQDDGKTLKVFVNTVKPKSPVEEAYKEVYGHYPLIDENDCCRWEGKIWFAFQKGYNASQKPEKEQQIKELVRESVKWCEEHQNESLEDYLRPKTPEQTEKSLKEAFVKAQQTEKWKETQKLIDAPKESWMGKPIEELVDKLMENPPDCLKFVMGQSLYDLIADWWDKIFVNGNPSGQNIESLIEQIELWLPKEQDSSGTQRIETEIAVEAHNELLQKIKSKLRNKKDT